MEGLALGLLGLAGVAVLALAAWLKRAQARFVARLRAEGDPLADHPGTKPFRQRFQSWLFGLGEEAGGPAPGRGLLTLFMVALVGLAAAWSLWPVVFG